MSVNLYLVAANKYMSENCRSVIDVVSGNNVKDTSGVAKHNCLFLGVNTVAAIVTNDRRVADVPAAYRNVIPTLQEVSNSAAKCRVSLHLTLAQRKTVIASLRRLLAIPPAHP